MKKIRLFPLLMLCPLLMANSPAPRPSETHYDELEVTATYVGAVSNSFKYELQIHNTGNLHAMCGRYDGILLNGNYVGGEFENGIFRDELIAPNQTITKYFFSNQELVLNPSEDHWTMWAYDTIDINVSFTNYSVSKVEENLYEVSGDVSGKGDYYYSIAFDVTYDGIDYSIDTHYSGNRFETYEELDLSKLTIKKATAYRSSYNTYRNGWTTFLVVFMWILIVGFALMVTGGIAAIIVVNVVKHKRRKSKAESN